MISQQIATLRRKLAEVCRACGCDPSQIEIVAVSKFRTSEEINEAITAGIKTVAENRVQEAAKKFPALLPCRRHLIGHLQTNKATLAAELFDCIESVDSLRLAEQLDRAAGKLGKKLEIYLQANLAAEESKFGFAESELESAVQKIKKLPNLELTGLMVIGPHIDDESQTEEVFARGDTWREKIGLQKYSAGMTSDWPLAVKNGSTEIRLGSGIFGFDKNSF